jgi:sugar phosphate isomerase/epimerase
MGRGICDFPALVGWLGEIGYRGWLIVEEESDLVWSDLAGAMAQNRRYLRSLGC